MLVVVIELFAVFDALKDIDDMLGIVKELD